MLTIRPQDGLSYRYESPTVPAASAAPARPALVGLSIGLPDAGHLIPAEAPDVLSTALLGFAERL